MKVVIKKYNHQKVEKKWQKFWDDHQVFKATPDDKRLKYYALDMFAYPSGDGLHVGHPRGYTATDILARYNRMLGRNVMRPVGWDAFGLPAENYAIKVGQPPAKLTKANIARFSKQVRSLGFAYDWDREISTADPSYYKWTQWVFKILYDNGYAYQKEAYANWCPKDQTVLANEQVIDGCCYRCGSEVEQKNLKQWFFKITDFADELIGGLDKLDWPESTKIGQRNWIGKSEGAMLQFASGDEQIEVFTTRPDTIFGATYLVLAPEHNLVKQLTTAERRSAVDKYIADTKKKSALDRTVAKEKTGVFTGSYAINPATKKDIPIWIADYVLTDYGTGAIMAVPAHDERDYEFAKKFDLPIIQVIAPLFVTPLTDKDAVRPDKKTVERRMITAIVKHWEEDKVFCLDWEQFGWKSFILGGIEAGETGEEAAIREVREESGYQNIKSVTKIGWETHSNFFAQHKDVNRYSISDCFVIELENGERVEPAEEHTKYHRGIWIDRDKVGEFVNLGNQIYSADIFLHGEKPYTGSGVLINSGDFNGADAKIAGPKMAKAFGGKVTVRYKLHDWLISRQRYWGAPIPIIHLADGAVKSVDVADLPVTLPTDVDFKPTGESPLALSKKFQAGVAKKYGKGARRELDTMDTFVCSSWYFLRYCDPHNSSEFAGAESLRYWMPVDMYIGGSEHTNGHLLYSRFITKVLHKLGYIDFDEPFLKLRHQGLILGTDGEKMSKSKGNVVNPDEVVEAFGADALRMYEMFMGPFDQSLPWNTAGIEGVRRFLNRVWSLNPSAKAPETDRAIHKLIKKVTGDIEQMKFNTIVSSCMEFVNLAMDVGVTKPTLEKLVMLMAPMTPHITEEIYQKLGHQQSVFLSSWPKFDRELLVDDLVTVVVQVNGKLRGTLSVAPTATEDEVKVLAMELPSLATYLDGKKITKSHYVPSRIINLVVQ